jgi:hypothetical protein
MVGVLQLWARDVPALPFPPGTDLLQILWCPVLHDPHDEPRSILRWRDSASLLGPQLAAPPPDRVFSHAKYIPRACVLSPEIVREFPAWRELSDDERATLEDDHERTDWHYASHYGAAPGTKVGGWPAWIQDPEWPTCANSHRMTHLLTVASVEYDGESWKAWQPIDEERNMGQHDAGLMFGDAGKLYFFVCPQCADMPFTTVMQFT